MSRRFAEMTEIASGITFRAYFDRSQPERLHITVRHGVTLEMAAVTVLTGESTRWIREKSCFETVSATHLAAWLWRDEAHTNVLVITCLRLA